ncbi:MAG: ABC transporter ATP-binding protein [Actinomycetota bacterium]
MKQILELDGVEMGFGANKVLHGVSLSIEEGRVASLLGLNGAGKSVTLSCISGLFRPWKGDVRLDGKSVLGLAPEERVGHGLAHVPQNRAVFPNLTVEQNLRVGAYTVKDDAKYRAGLERVYAVFPVLRERRRQLAGTMSGGEQGMLAVGRALMSDPRLILIDEPSAGLAPAAIKKIFEVIKQVNEAGVTVLLVEQNITFALEITERVFLMQKGAIVLDSTIETLPDPSKLLDLLGVGAVYGPSVAKVLDARRGGVRKRKRTVKRRPPRKTAASASRN